MAQDTGIKYYTLEEIAKNNGKNGARTWIIIKDCVYDTSDFEHPGGPELIEEWAGRDGTKAFDDFGHSGDAKKEMKSYKIGEVVEEQRKKKQKKIDKENKEPSKGTIVEYKDKEAELVINRSCFSIITCGLMR